MGRHYAISGRLVDGEKCPLSAFPISLGRDGEEPRGGRAALVVHHPHQKTAGLAGPNEGLTLTRISVVDEPIEITAGAGGCAPAGDWPPASP